MYKKYREFVQENLSMRDGLEQLAEEAAELSQAALKAIRATGLSDNNPTPVDGLDSCVNVVEEFKDVLACFSLVSNYPVGLKIVDSNPKWKRWAERLGYKEDDTQMELPL